MNHNKYNEFLMDLKQYLFENDFIVSYKLLDRSDYSLKRSELIKAQLMICQYSLQCFQKHLTRPLKQPIVINFMEQHVSIIELPLSYDSNRLSQATIRSKFFLLIESDNDKTTFYTESTRGVLSGTIYPIFKIEENSLARAG